MKYDYLELNPSTRPLMLTRTQRRARQARHLLVIILVGALATAGAVGILFFGIGYAVGVINAKPAATSKL